MKRTALWAVFAAGVVAFGAMSSVVAAGTREAGIQISRGWIRPTPPHAPTAAGYAVIRNLGRGPDTLLDATSPAADRLELHRMSMDRGIMSMQPLPRGISFRAGESIDLQRAGYHLMFVHPHQDLRPGDRVPVELRFLRAGVVRVDFTVGDAVATPSAMPGMRM